MAKFNWDKINIENRDYGHRLQIERQTEEWHTNNDFVANHSNISTQQSPTYFISLVDSIKFIFQPSEVEIIKLSTLSKRGFKLELKTTPLFGILNFQTTIEVAVKQGKLNYDRVFRFNSHTSNLSTEMRIDEDYIRTHFLGGETKVRTLIKTFSIIFQQGALKNQKMKSNESEVIVRHDLKCLGNTLPMTLTMNRKNLLLPSTKEVTLSSPQNEIELRIGLNKGLINRYLA